MLFSGSIKENILYGAVDDIEDELRIGDGKVRYNLYIKVFNYLQCC